MAGVSSDNKCMKQTDLGLDLRNRRTRKRVFLDEMERAVPWDEFLTLIAPHAPTKAQVAHFSNTEADYRIDPLP